MSDNKFIPLEKVEEIKASMDILQIINPFVSLKLVGKNYVGLCPFHNEKKGSFTVAPAKGFYKCFGCGKGGNAITFLMDHKSLTYPEALMYIANVNNIII